MVYAIYNMAHGYNMLICNNFLEVGKLIVSLLENSCVQLTLSFVD